MIRHKEILRSGRVKRWHSNPDLAWTNQTNAEHQWACAMLAYLLWEYDWKLLESALIHDVGEVNIGDMSSPAKNKYHDLKEMLDKIEGENFKHLGLTKPRSCSRLRLIDMTEAYIWAKQHAPQIMDKLGWPEMKEEIIRLADDLGKKIIIENLLEG